MALAVLFDLDGTLVDTRTASWELFAETNATFKLGIDTREDFFRAFESNFFESLARLPVDAERLEAAQAHFMQALRTRYNPPFIPGMADVVRAIAPHCTLAVVSTNDLQVIRRILVNAGVATCFSHVFSGDIEPRKSVSIRRFLNGRGYVGNRLCGPAYHDTDADPAPRETQDVVLVTDTVGDVAEAVEVGACAIGVSWGMHTEQQLLDAGAKQVALWPQELVAWLTSGSTSAVCPTPSVASAPPTCATAGDAHACQCAPTAACRCPKPAAADTTPATRSADRRALQLRRRLGTANEMAPVPKAPVLVDTTSATPNDLREALERIMGGPP